jgi:hypothetical protein
MRTKYGYEMSAVDVKGARQVRFHKDDGFEARATFHLTKEDLEEAVRILSEAVVRTGESLSLCCLGEGVLVSEGTKEVGDGD